MGSWNVGAFDNDKAMDTLAMLENVNEEGLKAFLWTALDSVHEEIRTFAIGLIEVIHTDNMEHINIEYTKTFIQLFIQTVAIDDGLLRREAYQRVCLMLEQGNINQWRDWSAREKELLRMRDNLAD